MSYQNFRQIKAIEQKNKQRLLEVNSRLDDESGIYFLTREDEQGFRYAYIGQAVHILTRLAQHLVGYQHIDLSLKKHGLYSEENPYGWKVNFRHYTTNLLDKMEQLWIKQYADKGYQLRNKTSGSQGEGKAQIADYRPQKGYRDGLKQQKNNKGTSKAHKQERKNEKNVRNYNNFERRKYDMDSLESKLMEVNMNGKINKA